MQTKPCANCGNEFPKNPKHSRAQWATVRYCSRKCQQPAAYATYKCAGCGKLVEKRVARAKFKSVVCSTECANNAMRRPRGKEFAKKWFDKSRGRWMVSWREEGSPETHKAPFARWLWEMKHGPISSDAQIHHRNGDRSDDRLENLQLVASDAEHKSLHHGEMYRHAADGGRERKCSTCAEFKPVGEFYMRRSGRGAPFLVSPCKDCKNARRRALRKARTRTNEVIAHNPGWVVKVMGRCTQRVET